jgi:tRNA1(Val) A37 N6-methylase TrmN6
MKILAIDEAASRLGVSTATLRNWAKAGHMVPYSTRPIRFLEEDVKFLTEQIKSGKSSRLQKRANKTCSAATIAHYDQEIGVGALDRIQILENKRTHLGIDENSFIYLAALKQLECVGEITRSIGKSGCLFGLESFMWKRDSLKQHMHEWGSRIKDNSFYNNEEAKDLYEMLIPECDEDWLGALYQGITKEGVRADLGSYFTSRSIVQDVLTRLSAGPNTKFLDPCCGSGRYLLGAAKYLKCNPSQIFGFDIDPISVMIARTNMFLYFHDIEFKPLIECLDSLQNLATGDLFCETNHLLGFFDVIATNPPWGANKNQNNAAVGSLGISSNETFAHFICLSMRLLARSGILSFLLPESILKIQAHHDIRKFLLQHITILQIKHFGKQFTNVLSSCINLVGVNAKSSNEHLIQIRSGDETGNISQSRSLSSLHCIIDVESSDDEYLLIERLLRSNSHTLRNNACWALGIVTGNNSEYILNQQVADCEPIFRGKDVGQFSLYSPQVYISFQPKLYQQVAKVDIYRSSEKLIYRFISNRLVFAYDCHKSLTLNSANILIPKIPGYTIKLALAFLNSHVFQFINMRKFATHRVLRGNLETLPFPVLTGQTAQKLQMLVDNQLLGDNCQLDINELVYESFGLEDEDVAIIEKAIVSG